MAEPELIPKHLRRTARWRSGEIDPINMAFLIGIVGRSATSLIRSSPSAIDEAVQKATADAAGKTIRAGIVLLRLENLKQKSPHPGDADLAGQKLFEEIAAVTKTTFEQEFEMDEQISGEDIAAIVSEAARKVYKELKEPKSLAELVKVYLKELGDAVNVQQELIQEFVTEFQREPKRWKPRSPWIRRRTVLAYYLGRWTSPIGLGFLITVAFIHAYWHESQGNYQRTLDNIIVLLVFIILLSIWFWLEPGLFPQPPEESNLSRKEYLIAKGGFFEAPIQFVIWFLEALLFAALILLVTLLTVQTIGGSHELQSTLPGTIVSNLL